MRWRRVFMFGGNDLQVARQEKGWWRHWKCFWAAQIKLPAIMFVHRSIRRDWGGCLKKEKHYCGSTQCAFFSSVWSGETVNRNLGDIFALMLSSQIFYHYFILKIVCMYLYYICIYLHIYLYMYLDLNIVVWELLTDFPQVGHHSSLLHSSVHL